MHRRQDRDALRDGAAEPELAKHSWDRSLERVGALVERFDRRGTEPFERIRARSRPYRSQILQVNARWKALAEIYTMHSFALFSNLTLFV